MKPGSPKTKQKWQLLLLLVAVIAIVGGAYFANALHTIGYAFIDESEWSPVQLSPSIPIRMDAVNVGAEARIQVHLKNVTDETLLLDPPKSSCGCTSVKFDRDQIGPSATATLHAVVKASHEPKASDVTIGVVLQGESSGYRKEIQVPITVQHIATVDVTSRFNTFYDVAANPDVIGEITVKNLLEQKRTVFLRVVSSSEITLSPETFDLMPDSKQVVKVNASGNSNLSGRIVVDVDGRAELHETHFWIRPAGRIYAEPGALILGSVYKADKSVQSSFPARLTVRGVLQQGQRLAVAHLPGILEDAEILEEDDGEWVINFSLSNDDVVIQDDEHITINVLAADGRAVQTIDVPVLGFTKKTADR